MNRRRAKNKAAKIAQIGSVLDSFSKYEIPLVSSDYNIENVEFNWDELPRSLDPFYKTSKLPEARAIRKRKQIESVLKYADPLINEGDTICDFGAGAGHIALLLSYLKPSCRVVVVEHNPEKHEMIRSRIDHLNSEGIYCKVDIYNTIDDFKKSGRPLDLGVSLHSCGLLTDETLKFCINKRSKYVLVPCCYGQITSIFPHTNRCTSSSVFKNIDSNCMKSVQSAADYTVAASNEEFHLSDHFKMAKQCMTIVDTDRQNWVKEQGYDYISINSLHPLNCSPKNNVIIGHPNKYEKVHDNFKSKVSNVLELFNNIIDKDLIQSSSFYLFPSPTPYYRLRCRFGVFVEKKNGVYEMDYFVYEKGEKCKISSFPNASVPIQELMKILQIKMVLFDNLIKYLEAIHFLDTLSGDKLVTLIYSNKVNKNNWILEANALKEQLIENDITNINFIGRSKNQKIVLNEKDFVIEKLKLNNGNQLIYKQYEGSFSNPNGRINERCLDWLIKISSSIHQKSCDKNENLNLLELYCGCGNHTAALASSFNHIVAVELDINLCKAANYNMEQNGIENVTILQLHSEKFCKGLLKQRAYKNISFQVVLVDPPRAGLDFDTLNSVLEFDYIIYISCNPTSLHRDFSLSFYKTHKIVEFAIFDQFAATKHLEVAVLLQRIENNNK